jgi:hypothetical protein
VIDKKQSIVDTHIAQIKAFLGVYAYNDIELFDWARGNQSHLLWYCDDISESPMLESVLVKVVKVLFEDISLAINFQKKSKYEQLQVKDALDLHVTLFNTTKT